MYPTEETKARMEELRRLGHKVPPLSMIKTPEQIEGIRASGIINTGVLDYVASRIKVGVTTQDIDDWVTEYTEGHGAICAPYKFEGFPRHVCTSIDEVVCHGIPSPRRILKQGDIINVDVSTIYKGYYSDASRMFCMDPVSPAKQQLVDVCKQCLDTGLEQVKPWGFLGDVGYEIEQLAERNHYKVVRAFGGHGVGLQFHEDPFVYHYGKRGTDYLLVPGMTFTIEPMLNMKKSAVWVSQADGWTTYTKDKLPSAQWEYTVLVTEHGHEILTH